MEITTKRILTAKSQLKMGTYADLTVERALAVDPKIIRYAYYHFEPIDFVAEVKEAAGIRTEIQKPGVSHATFVENERALRADMTDEERMKTASVVGRRRRATAAATHQTRAFGAHMSKGYLQAVNHGHIKQ